MFKNVGKKIKGWAETVCGVGILGSVITGLVVLAIGGSAGNDILADILTMVGIIIAAAGSFWAWLGSLLLYAFGQLVDNSDMLVAQGNHREIQDSSTNNNVQTHTPPVIQSNSSQTWYPVDETSAFIVGETNIKCANCRCVQFRGNVACNRCGAKFITFEQTYYT